MRCAIESREHTERLVAYGAGKLDPQTRNSVERHLEICPACRDFNASQLAVWQALEGWEAASVSVDFNRRLYARIDEEAHSPWWRRLAGPMRPVLLRRALPVMAAACLLVAAGVIADFERTPASFGGETRAEAVAADQVERTLDDMDLFETLSREVRAQNQASNSI